jgi:hypothetical protein
MIGCGMVASVRSDKAAQEELENEILYISIYTTDASELQLSFCEQAMVVYFKLSVTKRFNSTSRT